MIGVSQGSAAGNAGWALSGALIAIGFGAVAAWPNSVGLGVVVGAITAGWALAAWQQWRREERTHPVPAAEYFAALWALAYSSWIAAAATQRSVNVADALFLFPPVSLLPLVARKALGDDGDPAGRARSIAYQLHRICGWILVLLGGIFVVGVFFIIVAPLSLIPGFLNLSAASRYRVARHLGAWPTAQNVRASTPSPRRSPLPAMGGVNGRRSEQSDHPGESQSARALSVRPSSQLRCHFEARQTHPLALGVLVPLAEIPQLCSAGNSGEIRASVGTENESSDAAIPATDYH